MQLPRTISYDTETTGLNPYLGCEMFSYSTCTTDGETAVQRIDGSKLRRLKGNKALRKVWDDKRRSLGKVMHNAKFDLSFTEKELNRRLDVHTIHDTVALSHILQNHHPSHRLKDLAWEIGGYPKDDEALVKKYASGGNYQVVPENIMNKYQHHDAERCMLLFSLFFPKVHRSKAYREIYEMQQDLTWTTMRLEERGIMVDTKKCKKIALQMEHKAHRALNGLENHAGRFVNPNSPKQLNRLLFKEMKLPVLDLTPITKEPRTGKDILSELKKMFPDNPVLDLIMQYRSYSTGNTMLMGYLDFCDGDDIIHTNIHSSGASSTSRESSSEPNLQNVQKLGVLLNPFPVPAREVFRPKPGYVNIHVDYSAIEMLLLIDESNDPEMIRIINEGGDPHDEATAIFFGRRFTTLKKGSKQFETLRGAGKNANFAIPYGAGSGKVAMTLGLPPSEGRRALTEYERRFRKLCNLNKRIGEGVSRRGYVETRFGRRLHLPKDKPYVGTNYVIQGTAAGILKRAQNRVHHYLEEATGGEVGIILPIHDEIIIEFPRKRLKEAKHILRKVKALMIDFPQFRVPLDVDIKISTVDWETLKDYKI